MINKNKLKMTVLSLTLASLISELPANTTSKSASTNSTTPSIEQKNTFDNSNIN